MKKLSLVFVFAILIFGRLYAQTSASTIFYADEASLTNMVQMRGLEVSSVDAMRQALYEYEGLEAYRIEESSSGDDSEYHVSISSAENLSRIGGTITISGSPAIKIDQGDSSIVISASQIIIDSDNRQVTALENVSFSDSGENASIDEISADIITLFWDSGKLYVSKATTSSERKNSEDEDVTFYTTGERLAYLPNGGILYEDGYISSDPVNRYSSITAKEIAMLPGGDMFISNAYLSIGRVPILYLPFFFFPGSRILGNPAFGFDSSKGAFLNTTFEIFGSSPMVENDENASSFSAILRPTDSKEGQTINGFYYDDSSKLTPFQEWAEKSDSYLAIMADAYTGKKNVRRLSSGMLHFALDSNINLFDKALKLTFLDGIGLSNPAHPEITDSIFRYYGSNSISFRKYGLNIEGIYPFYSDEYVMVDFANRLAGFSLDPILGQDPEFPTTYSSSISSFSRQLDLSYSLPSKYTNKYLSSLSISNLRLQSLYRWVDSSYSRENSGSYQLDQMDYPYISANISGAIFSTEYTSSSIANSVEKDNEIDPSELHLLSDPLLSPLYQERSTRTALQRNKTYQASLKYSISETLDHSDDYRYGELDQKKLSSSTSGKITLNTKLTDWFLLTDTLSSTYSISKTDEYNDSSSNPNTVKKTSESLSLVNEAKLSSNILGLEYVLATKLQDNKKSIAETLYHSGESVEKRTESKLEPGWDKDTVTKHQISFSKALKTDIGTFTPYLSYTLKPLTGALNPRLSYSYNAFTSAFSWNFIQKNENEYESDLVKLSIGYNGKNIVASSSFEYQSADYKRDDFFYPFSFDASFALRSSDKNWSITEVVEYEYFSKRYGLDNYFDSIKTTAKMPYTAISLNWKTQSDSKNVEFNDMSFNVNYTSNPYQWWKGRIYFKYGISSTLSLYFKNPESSTFTFSPSITFSIAEFLDFKLSVSSYNNSFTKYFIDDSLSFKELFEDLARSFDFIGSGRYNTGFLLDEASIEVVHYMKDWDLHCNYSTEIVKSSHKYSLVPKLSIYMSWKTLPDLKVDENWKKENNEWVRE